MNKKHHSHEDSIDQFLAHQPIEPRDDFTDRVMHSIEVLEQGVPEEPVVEFSGWRRVALWATGIAAALVLAFGLSLSLEQPPSAPASDSTITLSAEDRALLFGDTRTQDTASADTDYAAMEDLLLMADQLAMLDTLDTDPDWAISELLDTQTL